MSVTLHEALRLAVKLSHDFLPYKTDYSPSLNNQS